MSEFVFRKYDTLLENVSNVLLAYGCSDEVARIVADNVVWNSAIGRDKQGLWRLPLMLKRLNLGGIEVPNDIVLKEIAPSLASIDAKNSFGQYSSYLAMQKSIELAKLNGIGAVVVNNSNWNGAGAYYTNLAAEKGLIGFCSSNSFASVASASDNSPFIGTNPFSFACPRKGGEAFIVDMSTSEHSGSSIKSADFLRSSIEGGLSNSGLNNNSFLDHLLNPFGGEKGIVLGLIIEILSGVLSGSGVSKDVNSQFNDIDKPGNNGHFFYAIDIAKIMPLESFKNRLEFLILCMKHSSKETSLVKIPGEVRWNELRKSKDHGVKIEKEIFLLLKEMADLKGKDFC